jgi:hypothetical protein
MEERRRGAWVIFLHLFIFMVEIFWGLFTHKGGGKVGYGALLLKNNFMLLIF